MTILCFCRVLFASQLVGKMISGFRKFSKTTMRSNPVENVWFISKNTI